MKIFYAVAVLFLCCASINTNAQWQPVNGPYGGNITVLAAKDSIVFAGVAGGDIAGIFRSTDYGANWQLVYYDAYASVSGIVISDTNIFALLENGPYLSVDNGSNWTLVDSGISNTNNSMSISACGNNVFVVVANQNIYRWVNSGRNWVKADSGIQGYGFFPVVGNGANVYAATGNSSIFFSTNNGDTWAPIHFPFENGNISCMAVSGNKIFVGTNGNGIFLSDSGAQWILVNTGLPALYVSSLTVSGNNIYAAIVDGSNQGYGMFLYSSSDSTWFPFNTGLSYPPPLAIATTGNDIYVGTYGNGVFLSTNDGTSYTPVSKGLGYQDITCLAAKGNNIYAGTQIGDLWLSSDSGNTWLLSGTRLQAGAIKTIAINDTDIFATTSGNELYKTNPAGGWTETTATGPIWGVFVIDGNTYVSEYISPWNLLLSTDNGTTWDSLHPPVEDYWTLIASGSNIIAASGNNGIFLYHDTTWTHIDDSYLQYYSDVAYNSTGLFAASNTYASYGYGGVFLSTDSGLSWTETSLTNMAVHGLCGYENNMFAITQNEGILVTNNNGQSWTEFNTGLPNPNVGQLIISENYIYTEVYSHGLWRRPLSDLPLDINNVNDISLILVYPNPSTSTFNFAGLSPGSTIQIYSVLGENIYNATANNDNYQINLSTHAMGIYFYRVSDKTNCIQQGKIILE